MDEARVGGLAAALGVERGPVEEDGAGPRGRVDLGLFPGRQLDLHVVLRPRGEPQDLGLRGQETFLLIVHFELMIIDGHSLHCLAEHLKSKGIKRHFNISLMLMLVF